MSVTDTQVKSIIDTERDTTPFISAASIVVTEELTGVGLSAARLDLITLYLAAHFCSITEEQGGLLASKVGDTQENYFNISPREPLKGFQMTRYGQQALALDTSGTLASLSANAGMKALFGILAQDDDPTWTGW